MNGRRETTEQLRQWRIRWRITCTRRYPIGKAWRHELRLRKELAIGCIQSRSDTYKEGRPLFSRAMKTILFRHLAFAGALLLSLPAPAHEFWLWPAPFAPAVGGTVTLEMMVGEQFHGERIAMTPAHAAAMRLYTKDLVHPAPLSGRSFTRAGTHLIAFDSQPARLTLSADKFHAYLHEEGLDDIIARREQAGTASQPGRERYRRHVKTLLRVGGKSDATYATQTGQRLEILPLSDPLRSRAGDTQGFRILFDGQPLAGALVKAWHRQGAQTMQIRTRTTAQGDAHFALPYAGPWMISVVHMIAAEGDEDVDWDSFWGNLTFERKRARAR